jgi:hypothetical protein
MDCPTTVPVGQLSDNDKTIIRVFQRVLWSFLFNQRHVRRKAFASNIAFQKLEKHTEASSLLTPSVE